MQMLNAGEEEMKEIMDQERLIDQEIIDDLEKFKMERELAGIDLEET